MHLGRLRHGRVIRCSSLGSAASAGRTRWQPNCGMQWWEPAVLLARWHRVTRRVADDGSCRPVWLAMKQAAAAGQVEVLGPAPGDAVPFGLRITVHATARG